MKRYRVSFGILTAVILSAVHRCWHMTSVMMSLGLSLPVLRAMKAWLHSRSPNQRLRSNFFSTSPDEYRRGSGPW